jgi:DNA-binding NtrC family response regulator
MNEKNDFALVPRPSSTLEKAEPGAKRILSGMVVDTLALVKKVQRPKPRIVVVDDEEGPRELFKILIRKWFKDVTLLLFDDPVKAWHELSETDPDLLITDGEMPGLRTDELLRRLAEKRVIYPVVLMSSWDPTAQHVQACLKLDLKVTFLQKPFTPSSFLKLVEDGLGIKRDSTGKSVETATLLRRTRSPRIVILDDQEGPRRWHLAVLKDMYEELEIWDFEDSYAAWQELLRTDPDLFITDISHIGISCKEMLTRLAERKVKYPIMVVSATLDLYEEDVRRGWGPGLNVSFLEKPVDVERYRAAVEAALQIPAR